MQQDTEAAKPYFRVVHVEPYRLNGTVIEFLVIKRTPEDGDFWQPITGTIEEGETSLQTLYREIQEEAGLLPEHLLHVSDELHQVEWTADDCTGRDYVHAIEVGMQTPIILNPLEHEALQWLPLPEALELLRFDGNKASMRKVHAYIQARHAAQKLEQE